MIIVRSPVRISFAGGGTDLPAYYEQYGGAVLSVAINKYFYSILRSRSDERIQVISSDLRVFETWQDISIKPIKDSELAIPLAVLKEVACNVSIDLFLASEIPPGTGLGSSASVCVNILKALTTYVQKPLSKYDLAEKAFYIAHDVLGKHVGKQDEYATSFGGLNHIAFFPDGNTRVDPVNVDPLLIRELKSNLLLFFTGAAHHSWTILRDQENSTRAQVASTVDALHAVKELASAMQQALERGELRSFGELLHEAWVAKRQVSSKISTARIDELYEIARRNGALGGKITGAGGGGFLLLYCEKDHQTDVRNALASEKVQEMAFDFDLQGAQVIVNDPFIDSDERVGARWTFVPMSQPISS